MFVIGHIGVHRSGDLSFFRPFNLGKGDLQVRAGKYPNTTSLANQFEVSKMEILKHGDMVEVIKPKSLRNLIRTEAEKITQIY